MTQLTDQQQQRVQRLVDQLSGPDFVCDCKERLCIHWQAYAVKVLSPLLDSDSQAAGDSRTIAEQIAADLGYQGGWQNQQALATAIESGLNSAATRMRDKCVEELKKKALSYQKDADNNSLLPNYRKQMAFAASALREASSAIESLTLDQEQEK